ncbi:MAG TPA: hypothetical protein VMV21_00350, partial [Vicinamibacteria bacterium]|nr:hypothetical protein [Vicinamibacteria bacterium]
MPSTGSGELSDVAIEDGRVVEVGASGSVGPGRSEADLGGLLLLPGFINVHDVLEASTLPATGTPPYGNLYEW